MVGHLYLNGRISDQGETLRGVGRQSSPNDGQGLWLWVAKPRYTQDSDDPLADSPRLRVGCIDGWWSCHADTKLGDLAFLYRTSPFSEVRWLLRVAGNVRSIRDEPEAQREGWDWGCDYEVLARFERTVTFAELSQTQPLSRWDAVSRKLHGEKGAWPAPMVYWRAVASRLMSRNPEAREAFAAHMHPMPPWLKPGI